MNKKVVTLGEVLLRLSPPGNQRIINSSSFDVNYGGAEINVAVNLSILGVNTTAITKVPDNEIGEAAVRHIESFGVNTSYIARGGERLGIYFFRITSYNVCYTKLLR